MPEKPSTASGRFRDTGLLVLASSAWLIGLVAVMQLVFREELRGLDTVGKYLVTAAMEFILLAPAAVYMAVKRIPFQSLFRRAEASQVITGACVGFLIVPVSVALSLLMATLVTLTGGTMLQEDVASPATALQFLAAFMAMCVAAPLAEEVEFRALVLGGQSGAVGRFPALLLTGLAFAMQHGQLIGLPGILMGGLVLTFLAWHSGSIWPSIAAHCTYNTSVLLFQALGSALRGEGFQSSGLFIPPSGLLPDAELGLGMVASAILWLFIALPYALAAGAVLWGYWRYTRGARWPSPTRPSGLGFGKLWPWLAAAVLLFGYVALDVLQVYGIIKVLPN